MDAMKLRLQKRCSIFAFYLSKEIARKWDSSSEEDLDNLLQSAMLLEDVLGAVVIDSEGGVRASRGEEIETLLAEEAPLDEVKGPLFSWTNGNSEEGMLVVNYPVISDSSASEGVIAAVLLGVSTDSLWQSVGRAKTSAVFISLIVLALSIALIVIIVRHSAKPIVELAEAAKRLSEGDLSTRVVVDSKDELGDLARAFNEMIAKLRDSREELKRLWEARERSKMEHVVESMLDAVIVIDLTEKVILANGEAREILALEQGSESSLNDLRIGDHPLEKWIRPVLSGQASVNTAKLQIGRPRTKHLQLSVSAMRGIDDEVQGAIAVLNDLTSEVEMSQQLLQSEKLAALGQLASGVAHEVNNPLTVISGFAEMLRRQCDDKTELNLIEKILDQAQRCSQIVTSLSRFSRKSSHERSVCDINKTLEETASLLMSQLRKVNVNLLMDLCHGPAKVVANVNELQQVIFNLINNSRDAMPKGGTITLRSDVLKDSVRFSIKDEGKGIAKEKQSDIFTPFFTTKDPGKGTGLGLAVCTRIINELGGRISVESELGKGSTFFVHLPRASKKDEGKDKEAPAWIPKLTPPRVLVVDDEKDILSFCSFILDEMKLESDCYTKAKDAILASRENDYGLYLFDVRMPGMNGPELLMEIRKEGLDIPVIFMSGLLDIDGSTLNKEELGPHGFVRKPFEIDDLNRALVELLPQDQSSKR